MYLRSCAEGEGRTSKIGSTNVSGRKLAVMYRSCEKRAVVRFSSFPSSTNPIATKKLVSWDNLATAFSNDPLNSYTKPSLKFLSISVRSRFRLMFYFPSISRVWINVYQEEFWLVNWRRSVHFYRKQRESKTFGAFLQKTKRIDNLIIVEEDSKWTISWEEIIGKFILMQKIAQKLKQRSFTSLGLLLATILMMHVTTKLRRITGI